MSASGAFTRALATLGSSLGLYGQHFAALTLISLVPALSRMTFFLSPEGSLQGVIALLEGVVGFFRFLLFYAAYRAVFPGDLAAWSRHAGGGEEGSGAAVPSPPARSRPSWQEVLSHVLLMTAVFLALNAMANLLGGAIASLFIDVRPGAADHAFERALPWRDAARYVLKNLFIIPLWLVHLLAVVRALFVKG